jgi:AbrB family looped-hinge helix DNA binding protein
METKQETTFQCKSTGIVRRIDDLGRVVIPRELRKVLSVVEGDPLEFCWCDKHICVKKYSVEE